MRTAYILSILAGLFICGSALFSQTENSRPEQLVSTGWLEGHLEDPQLVILHFGREADYKKGHIPGARWISLKDIMVDRENGLRHEIPDGPDTEELFRSWGIHQNARIIICYDDENAIPMAARLYLTMDYAGLGDQSAILNGGLAAWKAEERILTDNVTPYGKGDLTIQINNGILVQKGDVLEGLKNDRVVIVDARPEPQYSGTARDYNADRRGHIEGAVNIPFNQLTTEELPYMFRPVKELQAVFEDQDIESGSTVITYCGSGIWAAPVYFAARLLGYNVRFYDASFQEWGNDKSLPISNPADFE